MCKNKHDLNNILMEIIRVASEMNYKVTKIIEIIESDDGENELYSVLIDANTISKILISSKLIEMISAYPENKSKGILIFIIGHEFGHVILKEGITSKYKNDNTDINKRKEFNADNLAFEIMFIGMKLPIEYKSYIEDYFMYFHYKNDIINLPDVNYYHPKNIDRISNLNNIIDKIFK